MSVPRTWRTRAAEHRREAREFSVPCFVGCDPYGNLVGMPSRR